MRFLVGYPIALAGVLLHSGRANRRLVQKIVALPGTMVTGRICFSSPVYPPIWSSASVVLSSSSPTHCRAATVEG